VTEQDPTRDENVALADQMIGKEIDPASQSLAGALRTSFRLLSVIMVILLVAYAFSGVQTIESDERGVVLRFGRMAGATEAIRGAVLGEGIHFTWPFPIGEVLVVSIQERQMSLDSFWHYEHPGQEALTEDAKQPSGRGLSPIRDGSLLTGDQGLVHLKWTVTYRVGREDRHVLDYVANIGDRIGAEAELLRSVIENASVRTAAGFTADVITRGDRSFSVATRALAQKMLNDLESGLQITNLTLSAQTPPLQTLAAFRDVTMAENQREQDIDAAKQEATGILQAAAGDNWEPIHLAILAYERVLDDEDQAAGKYREIVDLLHDDATKGETRRIIDNARAVANTTVTTARAAYERYSKQLDAYLRAPNLTITMLWLKTMEDIMANDMAVKTYVPEGVKTVLYMKHDPSVWRKIQLRKAEETADAIDPWKNQR